MINIVLDKTTGVRTACTCVSEKVEGKESETTFEYQGRIQDFVLGGSALVSCSTSTPINLIVFFFGRIPGGGEGGEGGLEKLCVPVEKFGLYTWKQQDLEVVILYKKFEWHPDSLIAVIYGKISLKFHVPVDMPNHPPGTGAQKWEVKDSFEATIRVKQSLMAIILKHLHLTNRDTDL